MGLPADSESESAAATGSGGASTVTVQGGVSESATEEADRRTAWAGRPALAMDGRGDWSRGVIMIAAARPQERRLYTGPDHDGLLCVRC